MFKLYQIPIRVLGSANHRGRSRGSRDAYRPERLEKHCFALGQIAIDGRLGPDT